MIHIHEAAYAPGASLLGMERLYNTSGDLDPADGYPIPIDFEGETIVIQPKGSVWELAWLRMPYTDSNGRKKAYKNRVWQRVVGKDGKPVSNEKNYVDCAPRFAAWALDGRNSARSTGETFFADRVSGVPHLRRAAELGKQVTDQLVELRDMESRQEARLAELMAEEDRLRARIAELQAEAKMAEKDKKRAG